MNLDTFRNTGVQSAVQPAPGASKRVRHRRIKHWPVALRAWLWGGAFVCAAAAMLWVYMGLAAHVVSNSDDAAALLQASAILHGNPLLHGFLLPPDTFLFTDLPFYVTAMWVAGFTPNLMHIVPALIYLLTVIAAAILACRRLAGRERIVSCMIVVALLGLPTPGLWFYGLQGPIHMGTLLFTVLALIALDFTETPSPHRASSAVRGSITRASATGGSAARIAAAQASPAQAPIVSASNVSASTTRVSAAHARPMAFRNRTHSAPREWSWLQFAPHSIFMVCLFAAASSDPLAVLVCTLPTLIVYAKSIRFHTWRMYKHEIVVLLATFGVTLLSFDVTHLITNVGGYTLIPMHTSFISLQDFSHSLALFVGDALDLFGADFFGLSFSSSQAVIALLRLAAVVGFLVALWRQLKGLLSARVVQVDHRGPETSASSPSITVDLAADTSARTVSSEAAKVMFAPRDRVADILTLGILVDALIFLFSTQPYVDSRTERYLLPLIVYGTVLIGRHAPYWLARFGRRVAAAIPLVLCALGAAAMWAQATTPVAPQPADMLSAWLQQHHLTNGYGGYWDASIVTAESTGASHVLAVREMGGRLVPYPWLADQRLYGGALSHPANFLVFDASEYQGVDFTSAVATFGRRAQEYQLGPYFILVWDHDLRSALMAAAHA